MGKQPPAEERFWQKVNKVGPDECWEWTGGKARRGYGHFQVEGKTMKAHRFSYHLHVGIIPDGLFVLHECDNPPCVNPKHLFLGTSLDNIHDMMRKGRMNCSFQGKHHGRPRKLSDEAVDAMRLEYAAGGITFETLASKYGISPGYTHSVVRCHRRFRNPH